MMYWLICCNYLVIFYMLENRINLFYSSIANKCETISPFLCMCTIFNSFEIFWNLYLFFFLFIYYVIFYDFFLSFRLIRDFQWYIFFFLFVSYVIFNDILLFFSLRLIRDFLCAAFRSPTYIGLLPVYVLCGGHVVLAGASGGMLWGLKMVSVLCGACCGALGWWVCYVGHGFREIF